MQDKFGQTLEEGDYAIGTDSGYNSYDVDLFQVRNFTAANVRIDRIFRQNRDEWQIISPTKRGILRNPKYLIKVPPKEFNRIRLMLSIKTN